MDIRQQNSIDGIFTTDVDKYLLCGGARLGVCEAIRVVHKAETMISTEDINSCSVDEVYYFFAIWTTVTQDQSPPYVTLRATHHLRRPKYGPIQPFAHGRVSHLRPIRWHCETPRLAQL